MDLTKLINSEEIEKEFTYIHEGVPVKAFPKKDCTIEANINELEELIKVSGQYYFYGQMLGEIQAALINQKANLKTTAGKTYLAKHQELTGKTKVTDKMLEHLICVEPAVISIKEAIAELEGAETKLNTILAALKLKDGALDELSRRRYIEAKGINKLI